jgi:hypothetical protein
MRDSIERWLPAGLPAGMPEVAPTAAPEAAISNMSSGVRYRREI